MKLHGILIISVVVVIAGCTSTQPAENSGEPANDTDIPPPKDNNTLNPSNSSDTVVITHTSSGFSPQTVMIGVGETVVWKSETGNMWVASDQHPTHTEYSGTSRTEHCQNGDQNTAAFDQCSVGDRFSFTFEKEGEWTYHNHENSFQGGTVIVQ